MRTTLTIQDELIDKLMKYTHSKTKTEAVNRALEDWVRHLKIEKLRGLRGNLYVEDNWKELRALEIHEKRQRYGKRTR